VAFIRAAVRGREGQKNVPGAIGFYCACATEAKTHAFCYTLQLIRLERSVRGDHDNDRTLLLLLGRKNASRGLRTTSRSWLAVSENCRRIEVGCHAGLVTFDFAPNRNSGDTKFRAAAVVALNQDADGETALIGGKSSGRSS